MTMTHSTLPKNLAPLFLLAVVTFTTGCKKEFDSPPIRTIPTGSILTIGDLRAQFQGVPIHFDQDQSLYATVTADEQSGNLYKNIFIQDNTGAINLRLLNPGGLYEGDSIRLYLPGTVLSSYNGMLQIDSVDVDNNVVKQATLRYVEPQLVTIAQITPALQARLIRLDSVQFIASDAATGTWADAVNQQSQNRILEDCNGTQVIVRTSGYANFAAQPLPQGRGTFICVVGQFNSDMQLYVRDLGDVGLNGPRCGGAGLPILFKDFEDLSISSGGWTQQRPVGNIAWTASSFSGDNFAKVTNFVNSANSACESWYISPAIDLSGATSPVLNFITASNYSGANITVHVSTDYDGTSLPATATWTALNPTLSAGSWTWTNSGDLSLASYLMPSVHIAFKYTGTASDGKTWEVDDITIAEN